MINKKIALLQPEVPHYRDEFFSLLRRQCECVDIYIYNSMDSVKKSGFYVHTNNLIPILNESVHGFLWYNPKIMLRKKYDTLVLMLHFAHLTTWLLLLTKFIHRKKIILYGQGISVKRYIREEKHPDWKLKWMIALADGIWVYMPKEERQWKAIFPKKKIVALNNTITGMGDILKYHPDCDICFLKNKYNIREERVLMFCARFTSPHRRVDLLLETIQQLDAKRFGFIIIGDGINKPDFSRYKNVHDFGAVYDVNIKRELFTIADIYFQPGWVGLSIVEAMGYGLPVFTFKRSEHTLQCVEYSYIVNGENGMLFESMNQCIEILTDISHEELVCMGNNAKQLAKTLLPENMVEKACSVI